MRYHLYVNILQYLINSCVIIMGGQAPHNATGSGGGDNAISTWLDADMTTISAIVDANVIDPYKQNIALSSDSALAKSNNASANETGRASISEALVAPETTISTLLPNKYFTKAVQIRAAEEQAASSNSSGMAGAGFAGVNTTQASISVTRPSTMTTTTTKLSAATTKAAKATFATPIQSKKGLPKGQRTDAPMLNHIFDTISTSNKHHHHDHKYGPHFEDLSSEGSVSNITVHVGNAVYLNCRISLLQDKTVSWVRRQHGVNNLELLTVGKHAYSADPRYKVEFQYPSNWRLKIESAIKDDEGTYECQISTHPPRVIQKNLFINDPKVIIIDEKGGPLQDKYYEVDSTIQLSCIVRHVAMTTTAVFWSHGERILNYDVDRGGISVKTEILDKGANSTLFIAKVNKSDSGNYTCSINSSHEFTVSVHVLNGESFAELHHGNDAEILLPAARWYLILLILINFVHTIENRRR